MTDFHTYHADPEWYPWCEECATSPAGEYPAQHPEDWAWNGMQAAAGPYAFPEKFVPTGKRYDLDALFAAIKEIWRP